MSEQEIIKNNKLVAEFMGAKMIVENYHGINIIEFPDKSTKDLFGLKYHSSWDYLMPVVEKIEIDCKFDVHIYGHYNWKEPNRCVILDWRNKEIVGMFNDSKIQCVFNAVVEFIKWYNQNK